MASKDGKYKANVKKKHLFLVKEKGQSFSLNQEVSLTNVCQNKRFFLYFYFQSQLFTFLVIFHLCMVLKLQPISYKHKRLFDKIRYDLI